jgi:hypothetical protein
MAKQQCSKNAAYFPAAAHAAIDICGAYGKMPYGGTGGENSYIATRAK